MSAAARPFLAAALAALAFWLWLGFFPSPDRAIRRRLASVAQDISFDPGQGYLVRMARAQNLTGFFSTNVQVTINVPGRAEHHLAGRDEILQTALAARASVQSLEVKFPDVSVVVSPDHQSAVADVTMVARVAGQNDIIVQELKLSLQKIDGQWLITRIETVRPLSLSPEASPLSPLLRS